jgi:hypothetical protein
MRLPSPGVAGARSTSLAVRSVIAVLVVATACGGGRARRGAGTSVVPATPVVARAADWMVPLLPDGAQLLVEIDLARLRANPVVGEVASRVLDDLGAESALPGLPVAVQGSPLATSDAVVLAAYGVGTAQAATLIVLLTSAEVAGGTRLSRELVALGPPDWVDQIAQRAAIAELQPDRPAPIGQRLTVSASGELDRLREHAMPDGAPGATVRVTARLPFDARVAFARQTGLEVAPAQLSLWADVVDDFALVIDADAADPGDKNTKAARGRLAAALRRLLTAVASEPALRALGLAGNLVNARFVEQGTWVRVIVAVGPRQLVRATERARAMLQAAP